MPTQSRHIIRRRHGLKKNYGLTLEEFDQILEDQGGVCAICGNPPRGTSMRLIRLHVDHNHLTGRVRGLLCDKCNVGLGSFRDNPKLLEKAAAYLKEHNLA